MEIVMMCLSLSFIREVSFKIIFNDNGECNTINEFNEGIEFSIHLSSMPNEWIPINFIYFRDGANHSDILIGDFNNFHLRGYPIPSNRIYENPTKSVVIKICSVTDDDLIQFRWLQTSRIATKKNKPIDIWILDDIKIDIISEDGNLSLINESFDCNMLDQW